MQRSPAFVPIGWKASTVTHLATLSIFSIPTHIRSLSFPFPRELYSFYERANVNIKLPLLLLAISVKTFSAFQMMLFFKTALAIETHWYFCIFNDAKLELNNQIKSFLYLRELCNAPFVFNSITWQLKLRASAAWIYHFPHFSLASWIKDQQKSSRKIWTYVRIYIVRNC